jgi:HSP20 family protein
MAETLPVRKSSSIFDEMDRMRDRIMRRAYEIFTLNGRTFGNDLSDWYQAERELVWKPPIELDERDNEFLLQVATPGVDPKDIEIEATPEDILIRADVHHRHKEQKGEVYACEFASGNLFRSIRLPKKIDPDKVKADLKNGVLRVKAPVASDARARKVAIEAA